MARRERGKVFGEIASAIFGRPFPKWDAVMVALAAVDVVALFLLRELPLSEPWAARVRLLDWVLVAVFAAEWVVSLALAEEKARFARATWYDLVGLVPLHSPLLRAFRLLRVPHVLVWGSRFPTTADREFGGAYALALVRRYEPVIVEDLTDPLLVRVLGVLRDAVGKGRYAQAVGEGLASRRDRLRGIVVRAMREKPALRVLLAAPGAESAVRAAEDQLVDVLVAALTDPELDAVLKESMDDALAELQARVAERDARTA